jgi:hypothetical protein
LIVEDDPLFFKCHVCWTWTCTYTYVIQLDYTPLKHVKP